MGTAIATYSGPVTDDAFYFSPIVNGVRVKNMILDTRALELTFNSKVATKLDLPNLGSVKIGGVGGPAKTSNFSRKNVRK